MKSAALVWLVGVLMRPGACKLAAMAVPLHVKSHHSLGFGTASVEDLVSRAAALGYRAIALTDLETLAGQPEFHHQCGRFGLRAVSGIEIRPGFSARHPGARSGRLVLLARNRAGYQSLCRIVSVRRGALGSQATQRAAGDVVGALAQSPDGLVAVSDHMDVLERVLARGILPARHLALLVVRPGGAAAAVARARRLDVRPVADADVVMLHRSDHDLHRLQLALRSRIRVSELYPVDVESADRYLPEPHEWIARFRDLPEAVAGAEALAAECVLDLDDTSAPLPGADAFGGDEPGQRLRAECMSALAAAQRAGRCRGDAYQQRLEAELAVINGLGYGGYFLAAGAIADAARAGGILFAPRGSAVGSLVVHLLGISPLDPLPRGLLFERFLHARRPGPPDIDIDVDSERRDALIGWVRKRFGAGRVAMVGAHHGFRLRSALREGLRAAGVSDAAIQRLGARLPEEGEGAEPALADLRASGLGTTARDWLPTVVRLVGKPRLLAQHPAGVVVSGVELTRHLPLERGRRGPPVSQYDLRAVERSGFVKLDLLGSKVLSQLAVTARLTDTHRRAVLEPPLNDPATLQRLDRADTIGCFQVETPAVRALLTQVPINRLEDCVAALALVRPGAAAGAAKRQYVRHARRQSAPGVQPPPPHPHPWLAERLGHTHGVLLYDEDLIAVLAETAGLPLAEADVLRTAIIDAADDTAERRRLERRYLARARQTGTALGVARATWDVAARFAAYSFSLAHAWSYAVQAHAAAYQKTHHAAAFGCALIDHYGGAYPMRTVAADLARGDVCLLAPCVNDSGVGTALTPTGAVRVGLGRVKHLTARTVQRLLESRQRTGPYVSVDDLLSRVRPARRETVALVRVGACDRLPPLAPELYPAVHEALLQGLAGELAPAAFASLVDRARRQDPNDPAQRRYRLLTRIGHELSYLEMHLCAHPLAVLREDAEQQGCRTVAAILTNEDGGTVRLAAILAASRRHALAGGAMQFLTLEDETGLLEAVIAPRRLRRLAVRITTPGPYQLEGLVRRDQGHVYLDVIDLRPFHERGRGAGR